MNRCICGDVIGERKTQISDALELVDMDSAHLVDITIFNSNLILKYQTD